MIAAVEGLIAELRRIGIPVSVAEYADAMAGLRHIDLGDRAAVKATLGAALVKDERHASAFSAVFDLYFAFRPAPGAPEGLAGEAGGDALEEAGGAWAVPRGGPGGGGPGGGAGGPGAAGVLGQLDDEGLRALLLAALEAGEPTLLRAIAAELVTRHAGITPGRSVAGTYYLIRVMRVVAPDRLPAQLLAGAPAGKGGGPLDGLGQVLLAEEYQRRVEEFQREVEAEIRRRMVADRGAADVARTLRVPLPEDAEFITASAVQIAALRQIVRPMARKLAAGLAARQRRGRRGTLDFRRTARAAMSSGGVPMTPVFRRPRPTRPEVVVLADISGSVASFAEFTLHLTYALRSEFSRVRSFVFVDTVEEVTRILADADGIAAATAEINDRGCGVWLDGHSDYGNALATFAERHARQLRHRTAVLILGDARANYHASGARSLKEIASRAGHVYWLNPEPVTTWDSGDSVMREYTPFCDEVVECRNARQVQAFIERLG